MNVSVEVFSDLEILTQSLGDVGLCQTQIEPAMDGYQVSIPTHMLGKLKQHYAKRAVMRTISRIPSQSITRIKETDGKIRITVRVR